MSPPDESTFSVPAFKCALSLQAGNGFLDEKRLQLLIAIREKKTLSAAAEELKISYKTAWSWIDAMNNAAEGPLVQSIQGGSYGGNSSLTPLGERLLQQYERLCERQRLFMFSLQENEAKELRDVEDFLRRLSLWTSTRNQFHGNIKRIWGDKAQAWVDVMVDRLAIVTARITQSTVTDMDLQIGDEVILLIKATCMTIRLPEEIRQSLHKGPINCLKGTLVQSVVDDDSAQVKLSITENRFVYALIPVAQWNQLSGEPGKEYLVYFEPDHVILTRLA